MIMLTAILAAIVPIQANLWASPTPHSRLWAEGANELIAMGEAKAARWLLDSNQPQVRACHVLRLLYTSKTKTPLRAPMLGGLALPTKTMPLTSWPEFPMVLQDGVIFELASGYLLGGGPGESVAGYLAYCQKEGKFRAKPFKVPSPKAAEKAVARLTSSSRWKAIEWSYKSPSEMYNLNEKTIVDLLKGQARWDEEAYWKKAD